MKVYTENRWFTYDVPAKNTARHLARRAANGLLACRYALLERAKAPRRAGERKTKYDVAVCTIFRDEAPYLREWIEFHKIVGVDHFYLYNNFSRDAYREVLKPYVEAGLVTLVDWPVEQGQMACYEDCIQKYAGETRWLGFIDIDEFVVPNATETIYEFLKGFENRPAVLIYWRLFGTSGRLSRDLGGLVAEDFTVCWPKYRTIGKCFYNTRYGFEPGQNKNSLLHHFFWAKLGDGLVPPVNAFGRICLSQESHRVPRRFRSTDFPIQINHYHTKSFEEYRGKLTKGDVYFKESPKDIEYFYAHETGCSAVDYHAYKYLIKLKLAMGMDS